MSLAGGGGLPRSLANSILAVYHTLVSPRGGNIASAIAANTFLITGDGAVASGATGSGRAVWHIDPDDYAIPGFTAKLRVRIVISTNATAPGINFTGGLYPIASTGGTNVEVQATKGTVVSGSTCAVSTPGASNGGTEAHSADFDFPAAGKYALGIVTSGTNATNSVPDLSAMLQVRLIPS